MDIDKNRVGVILGSVLADLIIVILAVGTLNQLDSSFDSSLALMGLNSNEISPEMMTQLKEQSLPMTKFFTYLILGFFGIFHIIQYTAFFFEKEWPRRYLKILIFSGVFLSGLYVAYQLFHLDFDKAWVMLIFPSYLSSYIFLKKCPKN